MAAFELQSNDNKKMPENAHGLQNANESSEINDFKSGNGCNDKHREREECIIAYKIYDSCRQQDCLTPNELGPARSVEDVCIDGQHINEGDVIDPPNDAAAVTVDKIRIEKVIITNKEPNPFKQGFWDVDIKYVFNYNLTFREADGSIIGKLKANSIYNKKLTLFGSNSTDLFIATDLMATRGGDNVVLSSDPYIMVEAKSVALNAELRYQARTPQDIAPQPNEVLVTIGLFSIVKLYRIVDLMVESRGFCTPPECEDICPLNPCDFFDKLDFPMELFAPPERNEFAQP